MIAEFDSLLQHLKSLLSAKRYDAAIARCRGDVRKAAVLLDIAPATVYRRIRSWRDDEPKDAATGA